MITMEKGHEDKRTTPTVRVNVFVACLFTDGHETECCCLKWKVIKRFCLQEMYFDETLKQEERKAEERGGGIKEYREHRFNFLNTILILLSPILILFFRSFVTSFEESG
jgi:hypothetical protein